MNRDILKQIADAHYQLADLYTQLAADTAIAAPETFADGLPIEEPYEVKGRADRFEPETGKLGGWVNAEGGDQGSEAVCPKHRVPYSNGRYGPFCSKQTDDEAWGKRKPDGKMFCRITPSNAADYLRVRAAA